jgi:hypothetical protein
MLSVYSKSSLFKPSNKALEPPQSAHRAPCAAQEEEGMQEIANPGFFSAMVSAQSPQLRHALGATATEGVAHAVGGGGGADEMFHTPVSIWEFASSKGYHLRQTADTRNSLLKVIERKSPC